MQSKKNRYKPKEKIDQWIVFFFDCMTSLIAKLEQKYQVYNDTGAYLNNRQKKVLNFIGKNAPVKLSDIVEATGLNRSTLKKDLSYLVSENHTDRRGQGRGTVYLLKPQAKKKPSKG